MSRSAPPPPSDPRPSPAPWRPKLTGDLDPLLDRPAPSADAYDALADLFLGDTPPAHTPKQSRDPATPATNLPQAVQSEAKDPRSRSQTAEPVVVEGIILGHLPVTGMAWANQYARHVAEHRGGPVAVLKLVAGHGSLELIGARAEALGDPVPHPATLDEAVTLASAHCRVWLIRVDEPTEPKLLEPGLLDALTLLTGIDEAAVVASYRTAKTLMEPYHDDEGNPTGPDFGLALMGAAPDRAEPAAARIVTAAEKFLGRRLSVAAVLPKIGPGSPAISLFRGPLDASAGGAEGTLDRLRIALGDLRQPKRPIAGEPEVPELVSEPESITPVPGPDPAELLRELASSEPDLPAAQSAAEPRQVDAPPTRRDPASSRPLVRFLDLTPLRATCPYAPAVELAVGPDGAVHLLAAATNAMSEREAVEQLLAASAWVPNHLNLLRLTSPEAAGLSRVQSAVRHLFTESAPAVRRLLDGELRLHLLVRTTHEGRDQWVCADLN